MYRSHNKLTRVHLGSEDLQARIQAYTRLRTSLACVTENAWPHISQIFLYEVIMLAMKNVGIVYNLLYFQLYHY